MLFLLDLTCSPEITLHDDYFTIPCKLVGIAPCSFVFDFYSGLVTDVNMLIVTWNSCASEPRNQQCENSLQTQIKAKVLKENNLHSRVHGTRTREKAGFPGFLSRFFLGSFSRKNVFSGPSKNYKKSQKKWISVNQEEKIVSFTWKYFKRVSGIKHVKCDRINS